MEEKQMIIRKMDEKEVQKVYELIQTAFATAEVQDGDEQDYFLNLLTSDVFIPGLSLVAEDGGELVGHCLTIKTYIENGAARHDTLLLGPICVKLERRNEGIGGLLIEATCREALKLGRDSVLLVGNPLYYNRHGFTESSAFGIVHGEIPAKYVLARELAPGSLAGKTGKPKLM
jgi:putative acetyltransferase